MAPLAWSGRHSAGRRYVENGEGSDAFRLSTLVFEAFFFLFAFFIIFFVFFVSFFAKPLEIGSATVASKMGIVCVSRTRATVTGVVTLIIASGRIFPALPLVSCWHLTDVHADRYFGC